MSEVIELFPKKVVIKSEQTLLEFWKERNIIISEGFSTMSVYQKQDTLDAVLKVNNDLYEMVLKLKGEI
jgi:hypothetical protein